MKNETTTNPVKLQETPANVAANEIGKNMGYFHKTPKSHLLSYDQFVKASGTFAPATTSEEKKNKLQ
jgi:hypothetical protein